MAVGGDIKRVSIAGTFYSVASGTSVAIQLGGDKNAIETNGDRTARLLKTTVPWSVTGLTISLHEDGTFQKLESVKNLSGLVPITIEKWDGSSLTGQGQIVDEMTENTDKNTADVSLSGTQTLTK